MRTKTESKGPCRITGRLEEIAAKSLNPESWPNP